MFGEECDMQGENDNCVMMRRRMLGEGGASLVNGVQCLVRMVTV